jgi:sarcosine oxidase
MMKSKLHIAVVGAGAFGGWTALHLLERGARVTLLDAWGPGNSRASSGGETRVMRGTYGPDQPYTAMAARALTLWARYEKRWKRCFLHRTGVLWMASARDDAFERGSVDMLRAAKIKFQKLSAPHMKKRWPQVNFEDIEWGIFEPDCGYLDARASCQAVVDSFVAMGGIYAQFAVSNQFEDGQSLRTAASVSRETSRPGRRKASESIRAIALTDGSRLKADIYVFACGPWLGKLFPDTIGDLIQPTRQDIFFFGVPAGDARFTDKHLPVWANHRDPFIYGIPGSGRRGFKVADDTRGPLFDPTSGERVASLEALPRIREFLASRFPGLKNAPLTETRVCQYEQTPDSHFIIDRHPAHENLWIVGGGSGHGFKHGPALGEMMAELILKDREPDAFWRLDRFKGLH